MRKSIEQAQKPADTYSAIATVLDRLGDYHSFLITPEEIASHSNLPEQEKQELPLGREVFRSIGYLNVPGVSMFDSQFDNEYSSTLQQLIRDIDTRNASAGWIVDLRNNTGGNMWPMIAGLGPLLGTGNIGFFVYPDGHRTTISYSDGKSFLNGQVISQVENPYNMKRTLPPVALLTSKKTASSGEITLVTFLGRKRTKTFGESTWGIPTANAGIFLEDGARMLLTVGISADRSGKTYDSAIVPDKRVKIDWANIGNDKDPVIRQASKWLSSIGNFEPGVR